MTKTMWTFTIMTLLLMTSVHATQIPAWYAHGVGAKSENSLNIDPVWFEKILQLFKSMNFTTITYDDYWKIRNGQMQSPERPLIITFDDGFKNTRTNAYPLMTKYGFKGTIAYNTVSWLPVEQRLTYDDLTWFMAQGWEVNSHSKYHHNLVDDKSLTAQTIINEFVDSKTMIYAGTGYTPKTYVFAQNKATQTLKDQCLQYYDMCTGNNTWDDIQRINITHNLHDGLPRISIGLTQPEQAWEQDILNGLRHAVTQDVPQQLSITPKKIPQLVFHDTKVTVNQNDSSLSWIINTTNTNLILGALKNAGYCSITFEQYYAYRNGIVQLCEKPIILIFDDGRKSTYTLAYPLLQKYGYKGVLAIVPSWIGSSQEFMTWQEINTMMNDGWEVVSHSMDHRTMTGIPSQDAVQELMDSKASISVNTGKTPTTFVFPYYAWDAQTLSACNQYYRGCATSSTGAYLTESTIVSNGLPRTPLDGISRSVDVVKSLSDKLPYPVSYTQPIVNNTPPTSGALFNKNDDWTFYSNGKYTTSWGSSFQLNLQTAGNNNQLYKANYVLVKGQQYDITIESTMTTPYTVHLQKHTSPYNNYGIDNWQPTNGVSTKRFTATTTASDARLRLWYTQSGTYEIKKVTFTPVNNTLILEDCKYIVSANATSIIVTVQTQGCNVVIK